MTTHCNSRAIRNLLFLVHIQILFEDKENLTDRLLIAHYLDLTFVPDKNSALHCWFSPAGTTKWEVNGDNSLFSPTDLYLYNLCFVFLCTTITTTQTEAISTSQNSSSRGLLQQKQKRKTKKSPDFSSTASMNNLDERQKKTKICCLLWEHISLYLW